MKNIKLEEGINKICNQTIVVCKEITKNGKNGIKTELKQSYQNTQLTDEIELCPFKQRRIGYLDKEEMKHLSKTNPKVCFEKIILSQFENSLITRETTGTNYILPNRFKRFYNECVSFASQDYIVYFTDYSIKYYHNFISKLKLKRQQDSLKYSEGMINSGKVDNLHLALFDGFDFKKTNDCYFDEGETNLYSEYHKNTLHYCIDLDKNKNLNKQDLENMKKIIELFTEKHKGFYRCQYDSTNIISTCRDGSSVKIEGYDKHSDFLKLM